MESSPYSGDESDVTWFGFDNDSEPDKKRIRTTTDTSESSNTDTSSSTTTNSSTPNYNYNNLNFNVSIFNQTHFFLIDTDDRQQFVSIYNTLESLNIFDLNVPTDILHIISYNAVGNVVSCPVCDTETLVMHNDINNNKFKKCRCDKCDYYCNLLICCLQNELNQINCEECRKV